MTLVLSLFPGVDLLGLAFKAEGFCVVQGGDVIFGGDIRDEHYPAGKFAGVIAGSPCQSFSRLAHMVRQNGYQPKFGNLIPEFERVVFETQPDWFLHENVPESPVPRVEGYETWTTLLNNRQLGEVQNRVRRFSFGARERTPLMIDVVALEAIEFEYAATGGSHSPNRLGNGMDPRRKRQNAARERRNNKGLMPWNAKSRTAFAELCRKQGFPDGFDLPGFTVEAKCKAVGNAVPYKMARALARAVKEATQSSRRAGAAAGRKD